MAKYALVIGLDQYDAPFSNLKSAAKDAEAVAQLLEQHQYKVTRLPRKLVGKNQWAIASNKSLDYKTLSEELTSFFQERAKHQDAVLYFAGHGFRVSDELAGEEEGFLAASNATKEGHNAISFNSLNKLMNRAELSSLVVMMDCCHAGSLLERRSLLQPTQAILSHKQNSCLIAACRDFERAREGKDHGIFTAAILKGLSVENAVKETITSNDLFGFVERELRTSGQEVIHAGMGGAIDLVYYRNPGPTPPQQLPKGRRGASSLENSGPNTSTHLDRNLLQHVRSHWRLVLFSFCSLLVIFPLGYLFWSNILNPGSEQTETINPPWVDSDDQSQINSDSRILDIRVSDDATHFALSTAAGHLEIREMYVENYAFENSPLVDNRNRNKIHKFQKIDFLPDSSNFENERELELFGVSKFHGNREIRKYTFWNDSIARTYCLLSESESEDYFVEANTNRDFPLLAVASGSTSDIYLLRILKDQNNAMYVRNNDKGFCDRLYGPFPATPGSTPGEETVDLEFSSTPDRLIFATAHADNKVYLWQICIDDRPETCTHDDNSYDYFELIGSPWESQKGEPISSISFNSNGTYLAIGYATGEIKILRIDDSSFEVVGDLPTDGLSDQMIVSFSLNKDEPNILFSATNGKIQKWNIEEFKDEISEIEGASLKCEEYPGKITHLYGLSSSAVLLAIQKPLDLEEIPNNQYLVRLESC